VYSTHAHILAQFTVLVCLRMYLPDDDLVEVETRRRDINEKRLFITDLQFVTLNTV